MPYNRPRFLSCLLTALLILPFPAAAFETPLSDTAVREAYFLGQRHEDSLAHFLEKYTKHLPPAKTGPSLTSVTFLTPFALLAQFSSRQAVYSAQQAQIDHRHNGESVRVIVQFDYVDRSGSSSATYPFRPYAFWKDFDYEVFDKDELLKPANSSVEPNYICSDEGGCTLTGAALSFDFLPESFTSDDVKVRVTPHEGDPIDIDFDLSAFR